MASSLGRPRRTSHSRRTLAKVDPPDGVDLGLGALDKRVCRAMRRTMFVGGFDVLQGVPKVVNAAESETAARTLGTPQPRLNSPRDCTPYADS